MASPPRKIEQILREVGPNGKTLKVKQSPSSRWDALEVGDLLRKVPSSCPSLLGLDLSQTTFTDALLAELTDCIARLPSLKFLNLKSCGLGKLGAGLDTALKGLGAALKGLEEFETLRAGDNDLSTCPRELLEACKGGIYLDDNPLGYYVEEWSHGLSFSLSTISLANIGLNDRGLFMLASFLQKMNNLRSLNLINNELTDESKFDLYDLKCKGLSATGNRLTQPFLSQLEAREGQSPKSDSLSRDSIQSLREQAQTATIARQTPRPASTVAPSPFRFDVVVSGGGPAGLMAAICMAERSKDYVRVRLYGDRWVMGEDGKVQWRPEDRAGNRNRRRPQVVTVQDSALIHASDRTKEVLFRNHNENAWGYSKQIAIREVEDRLMELASQMGDVIELIPGRIDEKELRELGRTDPFDLLIIAEGSGSPTKKLVGFKENSEPIMDYSLGVAFDFDRMGSAAPQPQAQPLNTSITLAQTRYLLNSFGGRKGFLNVRLTAEEYAECVDLDGKFCTFGHWGMVEVDGRLQGEGEPHPGAQFAAQKHNTALWRCIESGLRLFNIPLGTVEGVMRIPIEVATSDKYFKQFELEGADILARHRKSGNINTKPFAALIGDAAFRVHFWPGRGLNSAFKEAIQLAIYIQSHTDQFMGKIMETPTTGSFFPGFCGWMSSLAALEQEARSAEMLKMVPVPLKRGDSQSYPAHHNKNNNARTFEERMAWLKDNKKLISEDLQALAVSCAWGAFRWKDQIPEGQGPEFWEGLLFEKNLHRQSIHEMVESGRWPTEHMKATEILTKEEGL